MKKAFLTLKDLMQLVKQMVLEDCAAIAIDGQTITMLYKRGNLWVDAKGNIYKEDQK